MKTRTTTKMVEVSTEEYVSFDGRVFSSKRECEEHELNLKIEECGKIVSSIPKLMGTHVDEKLTEYDTYSEVTYYRVSNEKELEALKLAVFGKQLEDAAAADFFPEKYPCWVHAEVGYDGFGTFTEIEDCLAKLKTWASNLSILLESETTEEYYDKYYSRK